jgi:hypothetical protein
VANSKASRLRHGPRRQAGDLGSKSENRFHFGAANHRHWANAILGQLAGQGKRRHKVNVICLGQIDPIPFVSKFERGRTDAERSNRKNFLRFIERWLKDRDEESATNPMPRRGVSLDKPFQPNSDTLIQRQVDRRRNSPCSRRSSIWPIVLLRLESKATHRVVQTSKAIFLPQRNCLARFPSDWNHSPDIKLRKFKRMRARVRRRSLLLLTKKSLSHLLVPQP